MSFSVWIAGLEWLLAAAWINRAGTTLFHLGEIPDLCDDRYAPPPDRLREALESDPPAVSVIVPALNEESAIGACLRSLLASRGLRLDILAVDDRSTDATATIMESLAVEAATSPHSLRVLHITELPAGWLGKPHALSLGAALATAPLLLFTDADAFYAPDTLARCVRFMEQNAADHLVLLPTPILQSAGERMMLGMIQALAMWGVRLWKIPDPRAPDSIGVGCFNLLRRETCQAIGGFEALRMEVVEDLRLGYLVKSYGFRQRVAFGTGLLRLHWAPGALGIAHTLEKNFFAASRYQPPVLLAGMIGTSVLALAPWVGLLGPAAVRLPSILTLLTILAIYAANAKRTRIPPGYALLFPAATCLILYAMARSAIVTLARGGVLWRGTFYPLAELRRNAGPLRRGRLANLIQALNKAAPSRDR